MKRVAVIPGSFDPLHNGHMWLIEQAEKAFDEVRVLVINYNHRLPLFDLVERAECVVKSVPKSVLVTNMGNDHTIDYMCYLKNCDLTLVFGMASPNDFLREQHRGRVIRGNCNQKKLYDVKMIYLIPPIEIECVSTTFISNNLTGKGSIEGLKYYMPSASFELCSHSLKASLGN